MHVIHINRERVRQRVGKIWELPNHKPQIYLYIQTHTHTHTHTHKHIYVYIYIYNTINMN